MDERRGTSENHQGDQKALECLGTEVETHHKGALGPSQTSKNVAELDVQTCSLGHLENCAKGLEEALRKL